MGKVIWIINHYALTPAQGGLCRHYFFAKELIKRGYTVRIFSSSTIHNTNINMIAENERCFFKDIEYEGVIYTYLKSKAYTGNGIARINNMLGFAYNIKKIWKKYSWEKPDIIYTSTPDIFTAWKAEKFAKKHKLPCVVEVRDLWPLSIVEYKGFSERNPIIKALYCLEKKIYKRANALVFTMPGGKDYIKDKNWQNKVSLNKIFNINNGVDIASQIKQRKEFKINDDDLNGLGFKIIYAGSIREANSVDLLIKAAENIKEYKDIKFLIYGQGSEKECLEKYCIENKLINVIFKGKVDKKYIPYICSKADINFICVKQTGISKYGVSWNKLFDYMVAGKPILSTVEVNYDFIKHYNCGISLFDQTPQAISDGILTIYNMTQEDYDEMSDNAKNAAKNFDFNILTDKFEEAVHYAIENYRSK